MQQLAYLCDFYFATCILTMFALESRIIIMFFSRQTPAVDGRPHCFCFFVALLALFMFSVIGGSDGAKAGSEIVVRPVM